MAAVAQLESRPEPQPASGLNPVFADLLQRQRAAFNQIFYQLRYQAQGLGPEQALAFYRQHLQAWILALAPVLLKPASSQAEAQAERAQLDRVALQLAALGLDLSAQGLLSGRGVLAPVAQGLERLVTAYPGFVLANPPLMLACWVNALVQLCRHPGARPQQWLDDLLLWGGQSQDLQEFLKLGQVLAWRAGLAHYRQGALSVLSQLSPGLQASLLLGQSLEHWRASPWCKGQTPQPPSLHLCELTAGFAGWGGQLLGLPELSWQADHLMVSDSAQGWHVFRDAWGESWIRSRFLRKDPQTDLGPWQLDAQGHLSIQGLRACFPELRNWRQALGNQHSLFVVMPRSLRLWLVAVRC